jgi:2-keto-3-deoxy-L-rhamnonate aldolase RhmA
VRENTTKRALQRGEVVLGTMVSAVRTPEIAPMLAAAGYQFMIVDGEHSNFGLDIVADIALAAKATPLTVLMRVPGHEAHHLYRPLDCGLEGLLVPHVDTPEQARAIARATKYAPLGERSVALRRVHASYAPGEPAAYMAHANQETLIIAQIESGQALDSLDGICAVPGIEAALIGPNDLAQSLGIPSAGVRHPQIQDAVHQVVAACQRHGIAPGIHVTNRDDAEFCLHAGIKMLMYGNDIGLIVDGSKRALAELRSLLG